MKRSTSLVLALWLTAAAFAQQSTKLSHEFADAKSTGAVDIIVKYKSDPGDDASDRHHQKVIRRGGQYKATHHIIHAASYRLNASQLTDLANDPDVVYISPDHPISSLGVLTSGDGSGSSQGPGVSSLMASSLSINSSSPAQVDYFRETVHADSAISAGWDGTGIGVAIIDSGIAVNEDFRKPLVYSQSFVPGDPSTTDKYGHGTHVAGIIVGSGSNSSSNSKYQFGGAAPSVSLINLRVLDANGNGTDSAVISAIERAIALKNVYNIRVINLSLGRPVFSSYTSDPLCDAVEDAWSAGITVVVAAGNEGRNNTTGNLGYGTILAPGNDPYVITVGAMKSMQTASRNDDLIASYSSKGPTLIDHIVKPDILAPGNMVISVEAQGSTLATQYPANVVPTSVYSYSGSSNKPNRYFTLSGTSMSAPVVAAAVASLLEKNPYLSPDQLKARLMKTASKSFPTSSVATDPATGISYTSYYDIFTVGAGYLDTSAALSNNDPAYGSAQSPSATFNSSNKTASLAVYGNSLIWGSSLIWGNSLVWGNNVLLSGTSIIWGTSLIWGDVTPSGLSLIWGDSVTSGASIIWGESSSSAQ
jgi:serine protease AprX